MENLDMYGRFYIEESAQVAASRYNSMPECLYTVEVVKIEPAAYYLQVSDQHGRTRGLLQRQHKVFN